MTSARSLALQFSVLVILLCIGLPMEAVEPDEVIINELYFSPKGGGPGHFETVELLVVANELDLNGLQVSDRDFWNRQTEEQCTLQDLGQGFLAAVRSGTLLVIHRGEGTDDTDPSDFLLRFYAKSSLFCNTAPTTNAFKFSNQEDNLHLLHRGGDQVDFIKYRASNRKNQGSSEPGVLEWENGAKGCISIGLIDENVGVRFLGNKPELNNFPAAWQAYSETYRVSDNIGKPNGGLNTQWINELRQRVDPKYIPVPDTEE